LGRFVEEEAISGIGSTLRDAYAKDIVLVRLLQRVYLEVGLAA